MTSQHWQAWATAQTVVCWLGVVAATGLGLLGGALILSDLADDTDEWHGFGVVVGLAACLAALFVGALFEAVRRLTRRGVDRATSGDPYVLRTSAHAGLMAVAVTTVGAFYLVGSVGTASFLLLTPAALISAPPIGILLTAPSRGVE
ncbi:MAG TPA: hypothetical protein VD859_12510 [Nocardioides sp.]|nr:hypothetical protein [Nocardioides sp.]